MKIIHSPQEMQTLALKLRREGKRIVFVPTMGALHEGHLTLLREGKKLGDILILSVYVNPKQFAPTEDLSKYPRNKESDLAKANDCGVDIVFFPSDEVIYPKNFQTYVEVTETTKGLCGASRPTHFRGVATVVLKLFNIVQPDTTIFGEKDYQQLVTIKTMVRDLNLPIDVVGFPIVREKDGLAMSSRNIYLSKEERTEALYISKGLFLAREKCKRGEKAASKLINIVKDAIISSKTANIDYIKVCNSETLEKIKTVESPARILAAVFIGKTRLIDNCEL